MTIFFIYKQIMDKHGNPIKVELVECDANETNAVRYTKLYNLQIPMDMRDKIQYNFINAKVI